MYFVYPFDFTDYILFDLGLGNGIVSIRNKIGEEKMRIERTANGSQSGIWVRLTTCFHEFSEYYESVSFFLPNIQ